MYSHRKRRKTEEKAKVVAAVWATEFIECLATPKQLQHPLPFFFHFPSSTYV